MTVDDTSLTLGQALRYLESSGKLESFRCEIIRQHVIEKELMTQQVTINPIVVDSQGLLIGVLVTDEANASE